MTNRSVVLAIASLAAHPLAGAGCAAFGAPGGVYGRGYHYQADELHLALVPQRTGPHWVVVQPYDERGRPAGRGSIARVHLGSGMTKLSVAAGRAAQHRVRYRHVESSTPAQQVWANRGAWFAGPATGAMTRRLVRMPLGLGAGLDLASDRVLARGYGVTVLGLDRPGPRLEVGRMLGFEHGFGVPTSQADALVLVARGTVGPVRLTATQRLSPTALQHWDYSLVLDPGFRRYVIPLAAFKPRLPPRARLTSAVSILLQASHPSRPNDRIDVDFLGLARTGVRVAALRWRGPAPSLAGTAPLEVVLSKAAPAGARVMVAPRGGAAVAGTRRHAPSGRTVTVAAADTDRVWLCYPAAAGVRVCDPPDAPRSTLSPPPRRHADAVLVDAFDTLAAVNAWRDPTTTFGSTHPVERDMQVRRRVGALALRFLPRRVDDYVGYFTPLPATLDPTLQTVELRVRGTTSAATVVVGLRSDREVEARVVLGSYLPSLSSVRWQTARLPLAAFAAALASHSGPGSAGLWPLRRLSVAMRATEAGADQQLELSRIRLLRQRVPVVLARFDDGPPRRTALGGEIGWHARGELRLQVSYSATGRSGHSLVAEVTRAAVTRDEPPPSAPSTAALDLGLGRLDARPYRRLCLWLRVSNQSQARVLLFDDLGGSAGVELDRYCRSLPGWQRVCIPLVDYQGLQLERLQRLRLAWDSGAVDTTLEMDDLVIE